MSLLDADLGEGRGWAKVGDGYAVTKKPRSLDRTKFPAIPFAAMEAIPQGGSYLPDFVMKPGDAISSGTYFERGDVLVGKITPSFENGKQALMQDLSAPFGYATTEVIPLHPISDRHDPRFLFFYLLHPDVRHYVAERMEGSTGRQRVPESVLLDLPIPELEPEEQTAVADAIETLHKAISAEAACEKTARDFKLAAMRALFTKGLRGEAQKETEVGPVPESWEIKSLGTHFSVVSGGTPSRSNPTFWHGGEIPWAKTTEVNYCVIRETEEHITPAGLIGSAAKLLPPGTLLMAMYGQGVTRGKVAILGTEAACNQACAAIRPSSGAIETKFLYHFLVSRYEEIRQLAHGGQQQNLNLEIVRGLSVCFPPEKAEQNEIVAILDAIDRKIDLHRRKRALLDELFKALLHKLMTGEIRVSDLDLSALSSDPVSAAKQTPEVAA
ncbi:restriction endonuclease subunit S [Cereibacter sphaeroides]|uniref:restriction endonuclease subunit S n=1 Tax=Cereibacter sphaeroides TaxID=1063 RepID=UPI001F183ED1|nr:restriction endonuclease subunit S [Cereibacter sphaeroides]MCE6967586.1 restriction endonuclease subunit S [Cereibacter sphaeroides]